MKHVFALTADELSLIRAGLNEYAKARPGFAAECDDLSDRLEATPRNRRWTSDRFHSRREAAYEAGF